LKKRILAATISDTSLQGIFNGSAKKKKAA
jgi:hypothetical protein